jgi:hypothetical protein
MAIGSNINPNFPIPGIDQSSRGFRDNFSAIKTEIENLQAKRIVLSGDAIGDAVIDGGTGDVYIDTKVSIANITPGGSDMSVQFNAAGLLTGDTVFTYNYQAETVIIGNTFIPDYQWRLDAGESRFHNTLLVEGTDDTARLKVMTSADGYPTLQLSSEDGFAYIETLDQSPILIGMQGQIEFVFNSTGLSIGTGSAPGTSLDVYSDQESNIARFFTDYDNSNNVVRFETSGPNSTVGLVLQQTAMDEAGGIRIGSNGYVSIHTGENNGAWLSDSSQVITANIMGQVGIGISEPMFRLDIDGDIQYKGPKSADTMNMAVDTVGAVIDTWDTNVYRSADYIVQITDANSDVEIVRISLMHSNGLVYANPYSDLYSSVPLGTFDFGINGTMMEMAFSGNNPGNIVKVDATYLIL